MFCQAFAVLAITLSLGSFSNPYQRDSIVFQSEPTPTDARQLYKRTLPGVALISAELHNGTNLGTGWLVDRELRLMVTNLHVVDQGRKLEVFFPELRNGKPITDREWYIKNGNRVGARILTSNAKTDLAILQLDTLPVGAKELLLAKDSAEPGELVHTVGNSGSSPALWIYTCSNVRAVYVNRKRGFQGQVVETSLAVDKGASGSPVLNTQGEVVAIVYEQEPTGRLVTLSVDVSEIRQLVAEARSTLDSSRLGQRRVK